MSKTIAVFVLTTVMLANVCVAEAQHTQKVYRIGYLSGSDAAGDVHRSEAFRQALRELGYIEGKNIVIEHRYGAGKQERFPKLAADLVHLKADIIVVSGGFGPNQAAKNATTTIPVIMMGISADPVQAGLVQSLARPGGNVTGITTISRELGGKRLELLKEAMTKISRVAVLHDSTIQRGQVEVKEVLPVVAAALGLSLRAWEVRSANELEKAFAGLNKERPDALYATSGGIMNRNHARIAGYALKARLPGVYSIREAVDAGGLMYYGADVADTLRRAAVYVDKILKGAKPADLPVEQPRKFELTINLKTAKQIGLTIPPNVLARADRVIK